MQSPSHLILTRKRDEKILIDGIIITVHKIGKNSVKIGITTDRGRKVLRGEHADIVHHAPARHDSYTGKEVLDGAKIESLIEAGVPLNQIEAELDFRDNPA